jgi:predicted metal-binding membrane protein
MSTQTRQDIGDTEYVDAEDMPREPRAKLVLRRLDPWSVLKFSLLFYFCLLLVGVLAFAVVWLILLNMGLFDTVTDAASDFNMNISFGAGTVFRWYVLIGLVGVLLWTVATVLLTLLFNLVNDITGGLEIVLAEAVDQA